MAVLEKEVVQSKELQMEIVSYRNKIQTSQQTVSSLESRVSKRNNHKQIIYGHVYFVAAKFASWACQLQGRAQHDC